MKIWFQCKIKYQKEEENGKLKKISEAYLVDAVSYTEAEARIYQELGSVIRGEFEVTAITKSRFVDIFHYDDNDVWYKCKVTFLVADEKSGKEKKVTNMSLVTAANVKEAYERIQESLSTMLVPFEVPEIAQSPIVEIFPYIPEDEREQEIPENLRPLNEVEAEQQGLLRPIPPGPAELEAMRLEELEAEKKQLLEEKQKLEGQGSREVSAENTDAQGAEAEETAAEGTDEEALSAEELAAQDAKEL